MKKVIVIIFLICIPAMQVQAQGVPTISLDSLLTRIETNYPAIIQYQYSINSLESRAEGAKAWMPPTFSSGLMRWPYRLSMIKEKNNPMNQAGVAFSLEQMITNPAKLNAKKDYLSSLSDIEANKREWTKNGLRREAKVLYYGRWINEKMLDVLKEGEEVLSLLITASEEKFSNNQSRLSSIFKAKASLSELQNMMLTLHANIEESNIGLNILMVQDVNTIFRIDTLIAPNSNLIADKDINVVSERSDIASMAASIQSMKLEQRTMKAGLKPDFGVSAQHMKMFGMPNQWSVMGMITIPIAPWSSKMYTSGTRSIGYQVQAMEQEKHTMELVAKRMISEKLTMLKYETEQYNGYINSIIPNYEDNMEANLLAFRQNTGDFFVLLDAWEMLLMKKLESYEKLFNILKTEADYEYETEIK